MFQRCNLPCLQVIRGLLYDDTSGWDWEARPHPAGSLVEYSELLLMAKGSLPDLFLMAGGSPVEKHYATT